MNVKTLKKWHSNHTSYSRFILANFVVFPLMTWVIVLLFFGYINHFASESRRDKIKVLFKRRHKKIIFAYVLGLQDEFILSLVFVVLALCLSSTAMYNATNITNELNKEIAKYFNISSDVEGLRNMYSLVIVTLTLDIIVFIALVVSLFVLFIYSICKWLQFNEFNSVYEPLQQESKVPWKHWWTFCMYSMLFPLCCLANHLNYIIIAFIHDLYHATSVAIVYGIITIFLSVMLDRLPYVTFRKQIEKKDDVNWLLLGILVVKIIAVTVLLGYVTIDIIVYFFIPIEEAFEDAANHFISVYSTTVVFFTGLVAFFFIRKSFRSQIQIFTKAVDDFFHKDRQGRILEIESEDWKKLGTDEKDVEVAKNLLKKIN